MTTPLASEYSVSIGCPDMPFPLGSSWASSDLRPVLMLMLSCPARDSHRKLTPQKVLVFILCYYINSDWDVFPLHSSLQWLCLLSPSFQVNGFKDLLGIGNGGIFGTPWLFSYSNFWKLITDNFITVLSPCVSKVKCLMLAEWYKSVFFLKKNSIYTSHCVFKCS